MNMLAKNIVKKLIKKKLHISVVESCTGGLLSSSLIRIPNASKIYSYGIISYSNNSKKKLLWVHNNLLKKYGSVSKQVCISMVKNLNKSAKTDFSVSITGIAGPSGGTIKKPVGLVYIAIKKSNKISVNKYLFKNKGRSYIQKAAVKKSLELISNALK